MDLIKISDKGKKHSKQPSTPKAPDLSGSWRYPLLQQLVADELAINMGLTEDGGKKALAHGTYTDIPTFTALVSDKDGVINAILDIFDENGNFCRFVWNGVDTWNAQSDPITFNFEGDSTANPPLLSDKIVRYPTLLLAQYDTTKGPWGICPTSSTYISTSGDGATTPAQALPDQCITQEDTDRLVWHLGKDWGTKGPDPNGLEFTRSAPQQPMPPSFDKFGNVFLAQSELAQLDFPYYGFDPRHMDIFSLSGTSQGSGTGTPGDQNEQNTGQSLTAGALIFNYPKEDSTDYIQASDLPHQPYLPLGLSGHVTEKGESGTSNQMASTLADTSHAWSVTLGISGGIEKMLEMGAKGTYSSTIEQQQKNESRLTITRKYNAYWTCFIDRLTVQMVDRFRQKLNDCLKSVMSGETPDWAGFVAAYGTHYLYAMTQGDMEFSLTEFTFEAQAQAFSSGLDISTTAKGIIEGGTVKTEADFKNELKNKTGYEFSDESVHFFSIGQPGTSGVGIFYDLRPLTELLSPLFFPYDPDDDTQKRAPWVWYKLRQSFSTYLESIGLNQPLDDSFLNDFTPHFFKVTFQGIQILPANDSKDIRSDFSINLTAADGNCIAFQVKNLDIPWDDNIQGVNLNKSPYVPDPENIFAKLLVKGGNKDTLSINVAVEFFRTWRDDGQPDLFGYSVYVQDWVKVSDIESTTRRADFGSPQTDSGQDVRTASIRIPDGDFTLVIDLQAEDLGPII